MAGEAEEPVPFRAIVEASVSPYVVLDAEGYVRWAGPAVELLLGRPAESYLGTHFLEVIDPASHEAAIAAYDDFVRSGREQPWIGPPMLLDLVGADGPVTCEVSASSGAAVGIDGAVLLVRRWRGTVLLYQAVDAIVGGAPLDEVLRTLVELVEHDLPETTVTLAIGWDGERFGTVVDGSGGAGDLVAATWERSPWRTAIETDEIVGDPDLAALPAELAATAEARGFAACWALPVRVRTDSDPSAALVAWRRHPGPATPHLTTTAKRVAQLVALALESERTRATWERALRTDDLTGLSRRLDLEDHRRRVALTDPDRPIAALFCDLDDFKPVNDALGHDTGDRVLAELAARIRGAVRPTDVVARWGGDEFVVLCAGPTSVEDATGIAERLITEVGRPIAAEGEDVQLGLSVGVATALAGRSGDLIRRADDALLQAKAAGKNQWRLAAAG